MRRPRDRSPARGIPPPDTPVTARIRPPRRAGPRPEVEPKAHGLLPTGTGRAIPCPPFFRGRRQGTTIAAVLPATVAVDSLERVLWWLFRSSIGAATRARVLLAIREARAGSPHRSVRDARRHRRDRVDGRARLAVRPLRRLREDVCRHRSAVRPRTDLRPRGLPFRGRPDVAHPVRCVRPRPRRTRTVRARGAWLPDRGFRGLSVLESAVSRAVRAHGAGPATRAEPRLRPATPGPRRRPPGPRGSWCRRSLGRTPGTGSRVA